MISWVTEQGQHFDSARPCSAVEKASSHTGQGRGHGWAQGPRLTVGGQGGRYREWGNRVEEQLPVQDLWAVTFSI